MPRLFPKLAGTPSNHGVSLITWFASRLPIAVLTMSKDNHADCLPDGIGHALSERRLLEGALSLQRLGLRN